MFLSYHLGKEGVYKGNTEIEIGPSLKKKKATKDKSSKERTP